jgi:hypothetical protein
MTDKQRGLWIHVGDERSHKISEAIDAREQFTQVVDLSEIRPRFAELAIISLSGRTADYLAVATKGRMVATDQVAVALSNFVSLGAIRLESLSDALPKRLASRLPITVTKTWRPTPVLWDRLLDVLSRSKNTTKDAVSQLQRLVDSSRVSGLKQEGGLDELERDAIATALQTWGGVGYRKKILRRVEPPGTQIAPFLRRIGSTSVREDLQINHDHTVFPGMEVARRYQVGAIVLQNNGEQLTILNCNRQPLEETLGVDLIYYNHRFHSFVLVQYKRMTSRRGGPAVYRPTGDPNHQLEMDRMKETSRLLATVPRKRGKKIEVCRLSSRPFYFKLCEANVKSALDVGMVSGMYVPLDVWTRLLKSRRVKGRRGGVAVGWHNCPRRFSNSEFTSLLRGGWIGSSSGASDMLATVIQEVLDKKHMLILAATSAGSGMRDFRRNTIGQFTAIDDPLGSF